MRPKHRPRLKNQHQKNRKKAVKKSTVASKTSTQLKITTQKDREKAVKNQPLRPKHRPRLKITTQKDRESGQKINRCIQNITPLKINTEKP